jgi:hypothetical protein
MASHSKSILLEMKREALRRSGRCADVLDLAFNGQNEMFAVPFGDVERIQLQAAQQRFEELASKIGPLRQLADQLGLKRIERIEDVAPLLFEHTVYKSYPLALLEKNRFDRLTTWLGRLTTHDLGAVDTSGVESIDDWLEAVEARSPLMVVHSSGTSGKMSFFPRSVIEMPAYTKSQYKWFTGFRDERGIDLESLPEPIPMFLPGFKHGRYVLQRVLEIMVTEVAGSEDNYFAAFPGAMSADLQSLAGRLAAAEAKGETGQLALNPSLMARRTELIQSKREQPERLKSFFETLKRDYRDRRVFLGGPWTLHLDAALEGEKSGIRGLFASDSVILTGGGRKGRVFPDNWYPLICGFYGVPAIRDGYGMTELIGYMPLCDQGRYHVLPHTIVYLLDPDNGTQLPRTGVQTGRFAFLDLLAQTYWGGLITGDEVTVHWDSNCECGRQGPSIERAIGRYSEKRGGDDKISCAGAQAAHDRAIEHLASL